ncbi:hypothetical protein ACFU5Z_19505 [Streptomyces sp. NPDC057521]|uniref:hypothetical protein n=1 Tax=Streptomyces sp. NPDC057521 TaxID=3346156 RepID=UPI0036BD36A9
MNRESLLRYLELKVHHLVQDEEWDTIHIVGEHDRTCVISAHEKTGKPFNWQRPTAASSGRKITIKCFPGNDYVYHYALIIATYLEMTGRFRGQVTYSLPTPQTCNAAFAGLDVDVSHASLVVTGWGLDHFTGIEGWSEGDGYAWKRAEVAGREVLYLGFLHSIWGDVAGRVITRLAELGAQRVVYVGKVGALHPDITPNTCLATGNTSLVVGEKTSWQDFFEGYALGRPDIAAGLHITSPSILLEDRDWLRSQTDGLFVDPEIGPMGKAASEAGIEFGYLHVVSNNLAREYAEDLSNERNTSVLEQRKILLDGIRDAIAAQLHGVEGGR